MLISEVARQSGVAAKTIRFYESVGLLPPAVRGPNHYRQYQPADVARLRFIAGARALGLALAQIAPLLATFERETAPCAAVQMTLGEQLAILDQRIAALQTLRTHLADLQREGATRPLDATGQQCVCALVADYPLPELRKEHYHD
jgi:DNA-binding transcriptional MerR regulator